MSHGKACEARWALALEACNFSLIRKKIAPKNGAHSDAGMVISRFSGRLLIQTRCWESSRWLVQLSKRRGGQSQPACAANSSLGKRMQNARPGSDLPLVCIMERLPLLQHTAAL